MEVDRFGDHCKVFLDRNGGIHVRDSFVPSLPDTCDNNICEKTTTMLQVFEDGHPEFVEVAALRTMVPMNVCMVCGKEETEEHLDEELSLLWDHHVPTLYIFHCRERRDVQLMQTRVLISYLALPSPFFAGKRVRGGMNVRVVRISKSRWPGEIVLLLVGPNADYVQFSSLTEEEQTSLKFDPDDVTWPLDYPKELKDMFAALYLVG